MSSAIQELVLTTVWDSRLQLDLAEESSSEPEIVLDGFESYQSTSSSAASSSSDLLHQSTSTVKVC